MKLTFRHKRIACTNVRNNKKNVKEQVLRGIVNHSYSKSQLDSDWNKSQMDNSERNIEDNMLSDTNHYEVLEKYDEVENEEIGTKSTT